MVPSPSASGWRARCRSATPGGSTGSSTGPRPDATPAASASRPPPDLAALADRFRRAAAAERSRGFAASLGVPPETLAAFWVGWSAEALAWTFPMWAPATDTVTGVRLRRPGGRKFAVTSGRDSLFLPRDHGGTDPAGQVLLVAEGATDAMAAHALGFRAAGRPGCTGGTKHIVALVRAERLAAVLALHCRAVRVVAPPAAGLDLRQWVAAGATRADVETAVAAARRGGSP